MNVIEKMDEINLIIFHFFVIGVVVVTTAVIAFNAGKKEGYNSMARLEKEEGKEIDKDNNIESPKNL